MQQMKKTTIFCRALCLQLMDNQVKEESPLKSGTGPVNLLFVKSSHSTNHRMNCKVFSTVTQFFAIFNVVG